MPEPRIVLVCGSRTWADPQAVRDRIYMLPVDTIVITGMAEGADWFAHETALRRGMFIVNVPVTGELWTRLGKRAGHARNAAMLDLGPDFVIAFQRNGSKGTQGTIDKARALGIEVEVHVA